MPKLDADVHTYRFMHTELIWMQNGAGALDLKNILSRWAFEIFPFWRMHIVNTHLMPSNSPNQAPTGSSEKPKPAIVQNYTFKTGHYCTNPAGETERILKVMWSPLALRTVSRETVKSVGCVSRTCRNKHGWSVLSEERKSVKKLILPQGTVKTGGVVWLQERALKNAEKFNSATY